MPTTSTRCTNSGCANIVRGGGGRCEDCATRLTRHRPSAEKRGYGPKWKYVRAQFLKAHPRCCLCDAPATVPDHWPVSRSLLLAQGVDSPDSWQHLRPLCQSCHSSETTRNQPGGWNAR